MEEKLSKLKRVAKILDKVEQGSEGITELILDLEDGLESKIKEIKDIAETTKKEKGEEGEKGESGRNPLTVSKTEPINPQIGDLWYKN